MNYIQNIHGYLWTKRNTSITRLWELQENKLTSSGLDVYFNDESGLSHMTHNLVGFCIRRDLKREFLILWE